MKGAIQLLIEAVRRPDINAVSIVPRPLIIKYPRVRRVI